VAGAVRSKNCVQSHRYAIIYVVAYNNPTERSEAAESVEAKEKSDLPLLRPLRQDLPKRCALMGLKLLPS
jgi:hypothetical protein